jgi:hypothetical protein
MQPANSVAHIFHWTSNLLLGLLLSFLERNKVGVSGYGKIASVEEIFSRILV